MKRKEFIRQCGFTCLGAAGLGAILESCAVSKHLEAEMIDRKLIVPLSSFVQKNNTSYKRYVVLRNEELNYPLVAYRNSANDFTILLLRCSHQYNELNVNGEVLTCPAHGSEFDATGKVVAGPAGESLRSFPFSVDHENLYIQLA